MNIEEGKHYVTRDGRIVGPIKLNPHVYSSQTYPYRAVGPGEGDRMLLWRKDGFCCEGHLHDNDLVSEHVPPVVLDITVGKYYVTRGGGIVGPMKPNPHAYYSPSYPYATEGRDWGGVVETWSKDGRYSLLVDTPLDLMSEHADPVCATPIGTTAERLIDRLHQVTAFHRFETGDRIAACGSLSEEAAYLIAVQAEEIARLRVALVKSRDIVASEAITIAKWFNVYKAGASVPYMSKEQADAAATSQRLYCHRVELTVLHADEVKNA